MVGRGLVSSALCRLLLAPTPSTQRTAQRSVAHAKRFYRNVSVAGVPGCYEINLDEKKLKTAMGNILQVPSYPLALAVAEEWSGIKDSIVPGFMHLTGLSYTVVDNPSRVTKWDMVDTIMDFLPTDTVLFADENCEKFGKIQDREWWPLLRWFNDRHGLQLSPSIDIMPAAVTDEADAILRRHILSYNHWAVAGLLYGVEAIKSVILTLAAMERRISAKDAVRLSRLEVDFQAEHWGRVEWGHDMDQRDLEARFSAALLFSQLNTASQHHTAKKGRQGNAS